MACVCKKFPFFSLYGKSFIEHNMAVHKYFCVPTSFKWGYTIYSLQEKVSTIFPLSFRLVSYANPHRRHVKNGCQKLQLSYRGYTQAQTLVQLCASSRLGQALKRDENGCLLRCCVMQSGSSFTDISEIHVSIRAISGGSRYHRNVGKLLPDNTAQEPRTQPSSYSPPSRTEISLWRKLFVSTKIS
jgi:hypothetical protein